MIKPHALLACMSCLLVRACAATGDAAVACSGKTLTLSCFWYKGSSYDTYQRIVSFFLLPCFNASSA